MKQQILTLGLACLMALNFTTAQTSVRQDSSLLAAAYFDLGRSFFLKSTSAGLTFVTKNNWLVSGRLYSLAEKNAPQKPEDFQPSRKFTNGGGGGLIGTIDLDFDLFGDNGPSANDPNIIYRLRTLTAGKIFDLPAKNLRLRAEAGVAFLKINEAVDFVFVPHSEETNPDTGLTTTTTEGYTFSRKEYRKTGACARLGVEFTFSKYIGLNASLESAFAEKTKLFGVSLGLIAGLLK